MTTPFPLSQPINNTQLAHTQINNNNIKSLVLTYKNNNDSLPLDLQRIPIGNWNVSRVTIMIGVFEGFTDFNEPLNRWNVRNVTHMTNMFSGCASFNQPLNDWNVRNVTNMSGMFRNCAKFNQPLNNWNVRNVTNMTSMFMNCTRFNQSLNRWDIENVTHRAAMFLNCGIQEENKPLFRDLPQVNPIQIHEASSKIKYDKLNQLFDQVVTTRTVPSNYGIYIYDTLSSFIEGSDESETTKEMQRRNLGRIMSERLTSLNYSSQSPQSRISILNTLEYVKLQPPEFKNEYVHVFIQDCVHAYEGPEGMTCAAGALERIVLSLLPAAQLLLSTSTTPNEEYQRLIDILVANPEKLIPEYIRDWYKSHKMGTNDEFPEVTNDNYRRADLKRYLMSKFPEETTLIDAKIAEIADNIGYDDDDFDVRYGGRRKKRTIRRRVGRTTKRKTGTKQRKTLTRTKTLTSRANRNRIKT